MSIIFWHFFLFRRVCADGFSFLSTFDLTLVMKFKYFFFLLRSYYFHNFFLTWLNFWDSYWSLLKILRTFFFFIAYNFIAYLDCFWSCLVDNLCCFSEMMFSYIHLLVIFIFFSIFGRLNFNICCLLYCRYFISIIRRFLYRFSYFFMPANIVLRRL